jgi:AAA family ATP:ADP antiporter
MLRRSAVAWSSRLLRLTAEVGPEELRAVALAFAAHFLLLGSYYVLRPVRDTVATVFGVGQLQTLFTATFIGSLIGSPIYTWLASRLRLTRLLPGVFWFWLSNVVAFQLLFHALPQNRWVAGGYYVWFSVTNLFMVSVFWSLMVDLFSAPQATRLFALIAAGGELGAIAGPLLTRSLAQRLGLDGLLLLAAAGLLCVIVLLHWLMREKARQRARPSPFQHSQLERSLAGNPFAGFAELFKSRYSMLQAGFILLLSWVNTVAYFYQTDLVAHAFSALAARAQALADIDLAVNVATALILLFGLGRIMQRFGVTGALLLNPLLMIGAFIAVLAAPTLLSIQAIQVVRRVAQYAIARPAREVCFTVVEQSSRYKTKNVIDTVVYRFGDLSSAWMQTGLRLAGLGMAASAAMGIAASLLWLANGAALGSLFERLRRKPAAVRQTAL